MNQILFVKLNSHQINYLFNFEYNINYFLKLYYVTNNKCIIHMSLFSICINYYIKFTTVDKNNIIKVV